ncbi:MAG: peptide chain release factor N(5)-glutamine methyltransferase [Geminicoccaceae bacterium]|nr:peptide chain release factor N(5)-glutamine methyltransferase [Geminicoccaceae bacterium]
MRCNPTIRRSALPKRTDAGLAVEEALTIATGRLAAAGVDEPRREARLLLTHSCGLTLQEQIARPERELAAAERYLELVERRAAREPFAYITGRRAFWDLEFDVDEGVLVPRPETESLIEAVLEKWPDRAASLHILDLGIGSGCILVTLLHLFVRARGIGVDRSAQAIAMSHRNARRADVAGRMALVEGDWAAPIDQRFDLVVSNPPYIRDVDHDGLEPEVRFHEPRMALVAGDDGLDAYRAIIADLPRLLAPGGMAFLEIGQGQGDAVRELFNRAGLVNLGSRNDLAGIERCLIALRPDG